MSRHYSYPVLSRIAYFVQRYLIPNRVHAWIWLSAYAELDQYMRDVDHHDEEDDSRELFSAVSAIRIANLMRDIQRDHLRATIETGE
jgi:hypothetical protein